jgi:hypothetical protein
MRDRGESSGDAAQAFEDLRAEVSVLRRSVEQLPEAWEANQAPDYTESLGQIVLGLANVESRLQGIEAHPAIRATPAQYQAAIAGVGRDLLGQAVGRFDQASETFKREQQNLAGVIGTVRTRRKQWEWIAVTAGTALLGGLLVSPFAARLLPFGWDTQAAATIMRADRWHAGGAMMEAEDPNAWRTLANAVALTGVNQAAIDACREVAEKTKKEQHCAIVVPAPTAP